MRAVGDAFGTLAVSAADVVGEVFRAATPLARSRTLHHRHPCGCDERNCHCTCCVGDADLVVYTRLGERRVVPIRIENERSREREVKLGVSDFTTRGGNPAPVAVSLVGASAFTLGPCAHQDATLVVDIAGAQGDKREKELTDVDDCVVAVGDLRLDGCDIRPVRIAVAIVPRDCDPYDVECGCECC
jgi:hypothetical protein